MGVNKGLFNLSITICIALAYSGRFINLYADIVAGLLFAVALFLGRRVTKIDPQILEVYKRHIHSRDYYPPISGIHAEVKAPKSSVPFYEGKP